MGRRARRSFTLGDLVEAAYDAAAECTEDASQTARLANLIVQRALAEPENRHTADAVRRVTRASASRARSARWRRAA